MHDAMVRQLVAELINTGMPAALQALVGGGATGDAATPTQITTATVAKMKELARQRRRAERASSRCALLLCLASDAYRLMSPWWEANGYPGDETPLNDNLEGKTDA